MLIEPEPIIQHQSVNLNSNITTTSTSFVDMSGVTITCFSNIPTSKLLCFFSASGTNSVNSSSIVKFQLVIDGVAIEQAHADGGISFSTQIYYKSNPLNLLTPGSHTIKMQWAVTGGNTGTINAATGAGHHAILIVQEITV